MARLIPGLVGGILLASVTLGVGAADSDVCVGEEQSCPAPLADDAVVDPGLAVAPADNLSVGTGAALPDAEPTPGVTRTLGPPLVVQPFAGVVTSADQADEGAPARIQPAEQPKLPPGPPSRVP
jgi:hypothetical protein